MFRTPSHLLSHHAEFIQLFQLYEMRKTNLDYTISKLLIRPSTSPLKNA
jgi:hypothetical protein